MSNPQKIGIEMMERSLGMHRGDEWRLTCEMPTVRRAVDTALAMAWMHKAGNNDLKKHVDHVTIELARSLMGHSESEALELIRDFRLERAVKNADIKISFERNDGSKLYLQVELLLQKNEEANIVKIYGITLKKV